MNLAKSLIGGILKVVTDVDPSQFVPSGPPPVRRPLHASQSQESDEEKQFRRVFEQLAGDTRAKPRVGGFPLAQQQEYWFYWRPGRLVSPWVESGGRVTAQGNWASTSLNTCGTTSRDGRSVNREAEKKTPLRLSLIIRVFSVCLQAIYLSHDTDRSGLISGGELPSAFKAAGCLKLTVFVCEGFPLNDQLYQLISRRYSDENGNMDFDNFIGCLVRLDAMCLFTARLKLNANHTLLHLMVIGFPNVGVLSAGMNMYSCSAGAFKTLDKNNSGSIDLDIKEWLQLTMYS
ncbi:Calpain small subunit 2 [Channa argus]|uniref:Calpain small subunit 2 n=1 Tax=Channa argus TaxID=215402 RepID=A0A6G1PTR2_CHAAH|nr:Calpain small subunit 2 [Channa argus]